MYISKYVYDPKSYDEVVVLITFRPATTLRITRETRKTSFENRRCWTDGMTDDLTKEYNERTGKRKTKTRSEDLHRKTEKRMAIARDVSMVGIPGSLREAMMQ